MMEFEGKSVCSLTVEKLEEEIQKALEQCGSGSNTESTSYTSALNAALDGDHGGGNSMGLNQMAKCHGSKLVSQLAFQQANAKFTANSQKQQAVKHEKELKSKEKRMKASIKGSSANSKEGSVSAHAERNLKLEKNEENSRI